MPWRVNLVSKPYALALALTITLVLALGALAGLAAVRGQVHQRNLRSAEAAMSHLAWPRSFGKGLDDACRPAADRLCMTAPADTAEVVVQAAHVLGVAPSEIKQHARLAGAPPGFDFYGEISGMPVSVVVSSHLVIDTTGAKPVMTFPDSTVSVWLID